MERLTVLLVISLMTPASSDGDNQDGFLPLNFVLFVFLQGSLLARSYWKFCQRTCLHHIFGGPVNLSEFLGGMGVLQTGFYFQELSFSEK